MYWRICLDNVYFIKKKKKMLMLIGRYCLRGAGSQKKKKNTRDRVGEKVHKAEREIWIAPPSGWPSVKALVKNNWNSGGENFSLRRGILFTIETSFTKAIIESDSLQVVTALQNPTENSSLLGHVNEDARLAAMSSMKQTTQYIYWRERS